MTAHSCFKKNGSSAGLNRRNEFAPGRRSAMRRCLEGGSRGRGLGRAAETGAVLILPHRVPRPCVWQVAGIITY